MHLAISNMRATDRLPSSYDTGYEHSVEHWFSLKEMVEEADKERTVETDQSRTSKIERPRVMAQTVGV